MDRGGRLGDACVKGRYVPDLSQAVETVWVSGLGGQLQAEPSGVHKR